MGFVECGIHSIEIDQDASGESVTLSKPDDSYDVYATDFAEDDDNEYYEDDDEIYEDDYYDDDATGDERYKESQYSVPVDAILQNRLNHTIRLFFYDNGTAEYMGDIEPFTAHKLDTTSGHRFFATTKESMTEIYSVNIVEDVTYYSFVSTMLADRVINYTTTKRPHPDVTFIDKICTGVAARFRSLSSRKLDLWEEEEEESDTMLRQGEETTFNTFSQSKYYYTPHKNMTILGNFTIH
eukprot:CAMPEP_0182433308 /NCGR_PEP_ID=MMETSP1167-20130531/62402_1 /TAXON_ID=2988 /ORGANISM="Mallomonas Sp, Strain CCMP3275" /LENGTH=238 /DNA_ID=CAMNT_0024621847 /DNA_START=114 /DNA_END=827 /DNA_ORIENTATION=+